jgi:pyruvate dehydrogenase E2 component (dihydrolipoamide acetyltransferase)
MAEVVNMPKLGFDMAEGVLVRWVISEGQEIEKGQVLAEIETDKATVEVEASVTGTLRKHVVIEGTSVPVGEAIAVIGDATEDFDLESLLGRRPAEVVDVESKVEEPETAIETPPTESPVSVTDTEYPDGVKASPVARRMATELGIPILSIPGSGPGGRIIKRDVEAASTGTTKPTSAPPTITVAAGERIGDQRTQLTKLRSAIGRRMVQSKQELPHFYVTTEVDAEPMLTMRAQINPALPEGEKLSVNDFIVKATALALREFPNLNATLDGDQIHRHGSINVGIAVAVEDGLLTVVTRDSDLKPLRQLSIETRTMVERTRSGKVKPDDIEGSTFTVSNLGMFDVDHFIAIINPPEAAILAIGSVNEVPVVKDGLILPGKRMKVTLSADHRVTDGAEVAQWLVVFKRYIEQPALLLI